MARLYAQGFRSLADEIGHASLAVKGIIPGWLHGTLLRNGPAQIEAGSQSLRHWFDGLAMIHRFSFDAGGVSYANKFVRSPAYCYAQQRGALGFAEFATDPCRSIFKRVTTMFAPDFGHNTSVNITRLADRFLAWTETPLPIEFDPQTLRTLGVYAFDDELDTIANSPHPHVDPETGDAINMGVAFGRTSAYKVYRIDADGRRRSVVATLPAPEPAYMHSFSMTRSYIVLAEYPLVVNPLKMLVRGKPYAENLEWKPDRATNFLVVRKSDGAVVERYESAPFFSFHHVNAFERDGEVYVDLLAYPDAQVIRALYLDVLRGENGGVAHPPSELRRYRLVPGQPHAEYEPLGDETLELPRINYARSHTHDYRYVYGVSLRQGHAHDFLNQLAKVDVRFGAAQLWYEPDCYPGEPVFVAAPNGRDEDDGVILSVVLDARQGRSFLLVLDARSFEEVARAEAPHGIPFGFHGAYFDELA